MANSDEVFGHYVGHLAFVLFDSNIAGTDHMRYNLTLPTDPSANYFIMQSYQFG